MDLNREFHGPNAGYVLELYERFQKDPTAVDAATRAFFEEWTPPPFSAPVHVNGDAASPAPVGAAARSPFIASCRSLG